MNVSNETVINIISVFFPPNIVPAMKTGLKRANNNSTFARHEMNA